MKKVSEIIEGMTFRLNLLKDAQGVSGLSKWWHTDNDARIDELESLLSWIKLKPKKKKGKK